MISKLTKVAAVCANDLNDRTITLAELEKGWPTDLPFDQVTRLIVERVPCARKLQVAAQGAAARRDAAAKDETTVTLYVLPPHLEWPTFLDAVKQEKAMGIRVVVMKGAGFVPQFQSEQIDPVEVCNAMIKRRDWVAFVGHPGTGKSAEVNVILAVLYRALKDKLLTHLFHRIQGMLLHYTLAANGLIVCAEWKGAGETLASVNRHFDDYFVDDKIAELDSSVLVLEMEEHEHDPTMHMATLIAISSRNVEGLQLKSQCKGDQVEFFPRPPHTNEELRVLTTALFHLDREKLLFNLECSKPDDNLQAAVAKVQERIAEIGPLTREVLGSAKLYKRWLANTKDAAKRSEFLDLAESVNCFNLPKTAKLFVYTDVHNKAWFLSDGIKESFLSEAKQEQISKMESIHAYGFQLAELVMRKYLVMRDMSGDAPMPELWDCLDREYYVNPPPYKTLADVQPLDEKEKNKLIESCSGRRLIYRFPTMYFEGSIAGIDPDGSYCFVSDVHNMPLGEYFTVDKEGKELTFYQSSTIEPRRHSFSVDTLIKWKKSTCAKSMRLLYLVDWSKADSSR